MRTSRDNSSVFYSVGSLLSYRIAKWYYNDIHYVWCAPEFDSETQPHTSNPKDICSAYLRAIRAKNNCADTHDTLIDKNKAGIIRGADAKLEAGVINEEQHKEICAHLNTAVYEHFFPVIYIIPLEKLQDSEIRCYEVPMEKRASNSSQEYIISDLASSEFTLIDMKSILSDMFKVPDMRVPVKKAGN